MPNQPKTPTRSFRLSDETITKVDNMSTLFGTANRSDTIRAAVDMAAASTSAARAMAGITEALTAGLPAGISIEAMAAAEGVTLPAIAAADEASWINTAMPNEEANRRLLAALVAARPFLVAEAVADERDRTIRDVIVRLEGMQVDQLAVDHLKSLLA